METIALLIRHQCLLKFKEAPVVDHCSRTGAQSTGIGTIGARPGAKDTSFFPRNRYYIRSSVVLRNTSAHLPVSTAEGGGTYSFLTLRVRIVHKTVKRTHEVHINNSLLLGEYSEVNQ